MANDAWAAAPFHIKAMAGAYMLPVLIALNDMENRIQVIEMHTGI